MPHTYFALTLGPYDSEEAVQTLPAQLETLRIFRDLRRADVAVIYRLETVPEPEGDLAARFKVLCVGASSESLTSDEARSLLDQFSVTLLPAWGITIGDDESAMPRAKWRARLDPVAESPTLPIKPDWTPLVDLLRRRSSPLTLDLTCVARDSSTDGGAQRHNSPWAGVQAHHQLDAARFFDAVSIAPETVEHGLLSLHATLHSDVPVDDVLARGIGRHLLGLRVDQTQVRRNVVFPKSPRAHRIAGPPEVIIRAFHPPYGPIQGRGLSGARVTPVPIRFRVAPTEGVRLGFALRQGARTDAFVPVRLSDQDRLKHVYTLGKTGAGKTNFLKTIVRQDIERGSGVAVIDPHGDLVDYALHHVGNRIDDVILLDFSDPTYLPVLNPLFIDVTTSSDQELVVEELLDVLIRRSFNQWTGPVFEDCVRMFLSSVTSDVLRRIATPSIATGVDLLRHSGGRKWVAAALRDSEPLLAQEWETFNSMTGHDIAEHVRWVLAKFADFGPEGVLYAVTGGPNTGLSLSSVLEKDQILLVKLPEAVVGPRAAGFLGGLIFARLHRSALSRKPSQASVFYLHVDEFQKFVTADVEGLVAEARKFRLALTLAHQNLRQLDAFSRFEGTVTPRLREALFSNVGTIVCMRTSGSDVHTMADELGVSERQVRRIEQYDAMTRCVIDGVEREPFTLDIPNADDVRGDRRVPAQVRRSMKKQGYWRRRTELSSVVETSTRRLRSEWTPQLPRTDERFAADGSQSSSKFLDEWLQRRKQLTSRQAPNALSPARAKPSRG